jgi:hypothetical protein
MEVSGQFHAPAALPPREGVPVTQWIGGCVGPGAVLGAVVKRKIPSPRQESETRTPTVKSVAQRCTETARFDINLLNLKNETSFHDDLKGCTCDIKPVEQIEAL